MFFHKNFPHTRQLESKDTIIELSIIYRLYFHSTIRTAIIQNILEYFMKASFYNDKDMFYNKLGTFFHICAYSGAYPFTFR